MSNGDEVYVGPSGVVLNEVLALGLDCTNGCGPDIQTLHELFCEFLQACLCGLYILGLFYRDCKSVGDVAALQDDFAFAGVAGVGICGDSEGDICAGVAACGLNMDPRLGSGGCPCFLGVELGGYGRALGVEVYFLVQQVDVGHLYAVKVCGEGCILHCIVDIILDVVVQQVLVEAGGDEPHTH